ncbi:transcriptional regulator [Sphingomonas bacterium]|uniref:transcriptional regulator n=1 Tax=Sphingomonas bacterium TaxID=1895847 RepID=UPI0015757EC6
MLARAVRAVGSQSAYGRLVGRSQTWVWQSLREGKPVQAEHVLAVEAATGISRHELRPNIYPRDDVATAPDHVQEPEPTPLPFLHRPRGTDQTAPRPLAAPAIPKVVSPASHRPSSRDCSTTSTESAAASGPSGTDDRACVAVR